MKFLALITISLILTGCDTHIAASHSCVDSKHVVTTEFGDKYDENHLSPGAKKHLDFKAKCK